MTNFSVPRHIKADDFIVSLARAKVHLPPEIWRDVLRAFAALTDHEIVRFARRPPDQSMTGENLGWMSGRGSMAYELSAIFDGCTELARGIEAQRMEQEQKNAERRNAAAAGIGHLAAG